MDVFLESVFVLRSVRARSAQKWDPVFDRLFYVPRSTLGNQNEAEGFGLRDGTASLTAASRDRRTHDDRARLARGGARGRSVAEASLSIPPSSLSLVDPALSDP